MCNCRYGMGCDARARVPVRHYRKSKRDMEPVEPRQPSCCTAHAPVFRLLQATCYIEIDGSGNNCRFRCAMTSARSDAFPDESIRRRNNADRARGSLVHGPPRLQARWLWRETSIRERDRCRSLPSGRRTGTADVAGDQHRSVGLLARPIVPRRLRRRRMKPSPCSGTAPVGVSLRRWWRTVVQLRRVDRDAVRARASGDEHAAICY